MKPFTIIRIALELIYVIWIAPLLAVNAVYCAAEKDFAGMLRLLAIVFFVLALTFTCFMYSDYLRRRRELPSVYDRFDTEGIVILKWVSLGTMLLVAYWMFRGVDFMITGISPVDFETSTLTESDREGWLVTGLIVVKATAAILSMLLPLFFSVCLELRRRKHLSCGERT
jgi:hypothetical protein